MSSLTRTGAATAISAALLLAATSCGPTPEHQPKTVITLPNADVADHQAVFPESDVELSIGQTFTVSETHMVIPHAWYFTDQGDARIIRNGAEVSKTSCSGPEPVAGCPSLVSTTHTAIGTGTTTLIWTYRNEPACHGPQSPTWHCILATKTVRVTVH